jgi:hypothetical protein
MFIFADVAIEIVHRIQKLGSRSTYWHVFFSIHLPWEVSPYASFNTQ